MGRIISIDNEVTSQLDRIKLKMEKEAGNGENIPYGRVVKKYVAKEETSIRRLKSKKS